ncbi:hypothetical protein [Qipengyuania sp. DGS5-3]|uniref:hypothetical protein n=1 Tax=Qipengyuania sp. DGS5-3 TaxID=3349632 RepID=UPI0036D3046C
MSYDLLVFDQANAPRELASFENWIGDLRSAAETGDPLEKPSREAFQAFYDGMTGSFPDMNGPSGEGIEDHERLTGYEFQPEYVLMDFRWSVAEDAGPVVIDFAERSGLGVYDFNGALIFTDDADLGVVEGSAPQGFLGRLFNKLFG